MLLINFETDFVKLDEHGLYAFNSKDKGRDLSKGEASFGKGFN